VRFLSLDLLAFGPFADEHLDLSAGDYGLHVIYGPNEAGKSTCLRALSQLLYGFDHRSSDNFVHPNKSLRIGAALQTVDGRTISCVRRKGRKNTLRDGDDKHPLDPDPLPALLGSIDETAFKTRFGIDHEELRRGGEQLVRGEGELAESLFAAATGLVDLSRLRQRLEDEADELFKPRATKPPLCEALSRYKERKKEARELSLDNRQWIEQEKNYRDLLRRREKVQETLRDLRAEKSKLERATGALPLVGRRRQVQEQLAEFDGTPLLPDDFPARRAAAQQQKRGAQTELERIAAETEKLEADLSQAAPSELLLSLADEIDALQEGLTGYTERCGDRPDLIAKLGAARDERDRFLERLGPSAEAKLPTVIETEIRELATAAPELESDLRDARDRLAEDEDKLRDLTEQLAGLEDCPDPEPLERACAAARAALEREEQLQDQQRDLDSALRQLEQQFQRLGRFASGLPELASCALPTDEAIGQFDRRLGAAAKAADDLAGELARIEENIHKRRLDIQTADSGQELPTESDLTAARRLRDELWRLVERRLAGESVAAEQWQTLLAESDLPSGGESDLPAAFAAAVERADQIVDALRRESDRVTQIARARAELEELERRRDDLDSQLTKAREQVATLRGEWSELWRAKGVDPGEPAEMRAWLGERQRVVEAAEGVDRQRAQIAAGRDKVEGVLRDLHEVLGRLEQPAPAGNLAEALALAEPVLRRLREQTQQRRRLEETSADLDRTIESRRRLEQRAAAALEDWRERWRRTIEPLGVGRDLSAEQARAVLDDLKRRDDLSDDMRDLQDRIDGIDDRNSRYESRVQAVCNELGHPFDVAELPSIVRRLAKSLREDQKTRTRREQLRARQATLIEQHEQAEKNLDVAEQELAELCRQAQVADGGELERVEREHLRRKELLKNLDDTDRLLEESAGGQRLEEFISEVSQINVDQAASRLKELAGEIERLDSELAELSDAVTTARNQLDRLPNNSQLASQARQQAAETLAEIEGLSEQYARLKLASAVLRDTIESYRQEHQGPVLERAGQVFSELTCGSFSGLRAELDANGNHVIMGLRADGKTEVSVSGMSDGTADQLYLALRLASLQEYLAGQPPIPFVVDDILNRFDDDRARAALGALGELSRQTQVIFFTHHEHLLEMAESLAVEAPDLIFTQRLGGASEQAAQLANLAESPR